MHCGLSLVFLAITAGLINAAPTPSKPQPKYHFKAAAKGHKKCSGGEAMSRAYRKYGWDIIFKDPLSALEDAWPGMSDSGDESNASPFIYTTLSVAPWDSWHPSSSAAGYGYPASSSTAGYGYPASSSAAGYGYPSSSMPWLPIPTSSMSSFSSISATGFEPPTSASVGPSSQPRPSSSGSASAPVPVPSSSQPISSGVASSSAPLPSSSSPGSSAPASAPAPSASSPAGDGSDEGEVGAIPEENESMYISPVTIGGQKLNLDFDTGSADLWVFSTEMSSSDAAGHAVYDPTKSSTSSDYKGASWQIQYGDGSTAGGSVGFDNVEIGGIVVQKQAIELAQQVSTSFLETVNNDGLLGLAFSSINTIMPQPQKTWFENVMDSLEQPLFTCDLEEDASGTYEFGTIDTAKYTGDIHYAPVDNSRGFWMVESQTYTIGGTSQSCGTCSPTLADTGTSLLIMDNDLVEAYYSQVQGAQLTTSGYTYPCSSTLPDFGVAIGDSYMATIKGADMVYAGQGGVCFGGIQPNEGNGYNILGDVLLKQFFAVFDGGEMRFGLATKA